MTDCQLETASKNLCASLDPADKTAELERCESQINQLIERLARDGPERLEAERQIGDVLLHVKKIDPKNLVKWTDQTFGRGREWRCTHMALARRSDHLPQARAWAVSEGLKLAAYYSVDGALELLKAWDLATGQASQKPKRSLPKKARTSDKGGFILQQSPEQAEIAVLRQRLREQSDEAAYFRIELPLDIRSEARALLVRASARDDKAERELRAIARQHRWLFRDLCDALGPEKSGARIFRPRIRRWKPRSATRGRRPSQLARRPLMRRRSRKQHHKKQAASNPTSIPHL